MTGHLCPECGTPRGTEGRAGPGCVCAEGAEVSAAEVFDPLRVRPYVTLQNVAESGAAPDGDTVPPEQSSSPAPADSSAPAAPSAPPPTTAQATASVSVAPQTQGAGTLRSGDSGPAVVELQQRLAKLLLYTGPMDGEYDQSVGDSVRFFQNSRKVKGDPKGVYGPKTRRALEAETR
ncbi:peptidoglycan-binding domain-containing protein [Streptomyces sp. NPDC005408]|uniref:peptidoglycan-binding domain-containing protein n=1 Tax=Streptomyces sp. NPDC005408 TaxID=3155341 RepID=UPI0033BE7C5F